MPNFDGGHYFYTGLFPVKLEPVERSDGSVTVPSHLLRETLACLPNYSQAPGAARISPFARCRTTHFARLAVIDEPAFNGRDPTDAIKGAIRGVDLLVHQPVDYFSRAWLMFTADFDADDDARGSRDRWARELWLPMERELRSIFVNCEGFEGKVDGPEAFAAYLARGQVETTMSFNDYWIDRFQAPTLSMGRLIVQGVAVLTLFLAGAWLATRALGGGWPVWVGAGLVGLAAAIWSVYRLVMARGARPFPRAPDSDLPSVLKGLYLQQRLVRFASEHQGEPPDALHAAFGRFLAETEPANLDRPTQPPGVMRS